MWIIFFLFYLGALTWFMSAIGDTYGQDTPTYTTVSKSLGTGFVTNVVTGITILGFWMNLLLIGFPFGLLVYLLITQNTPTTNAGY